MTAQLAERTRPGSMAAIWAPHLAMLVLLLVELAAILQLNGGRFIYTLDDPYIHLALAENIAHGHYGINLSEPSAPSSSILWPFLLIPLAHGPLHEYLPLAINTACTFGSIALLQALVRRTIPESGVAGSWLPPLIVTATAIGLNFAGLVFTGMEHSLQVLLALLLVLGLVISAETRRMPWWLVAAVAAGPLVRYESLSMSVAALAFLALQRRWSIAAAAAVATALPLVGFSLFLHGLGLEWLPSSVLVKADIAPEGATLVDVFLAMGRSFLWSPGHFSKLLLLGYVALFIRRAFRGDTSAAERHLAVAGAIMAFAHLAGGRFGWFGRYEVYVMASATMLLIYVWRDHLAARVDRLPRPRFRVELGLAALLLSAPTLGATVLTPLAANNIYEQQYQMARFVAQLPAGAPVAVNDLGWASFGNDRHVLDLWGLGSAEAGARRLAEEPGWMDDLVTRHGVRFAMLYDGWFPGQIPAHWQHLGSLHLGRMQVTPAFASVAFYATDPTAAPRLRELLEGFVPTLPSGTRFEVPQLP